MQTHLEAHTFSLKRKRMCLNLLDFRAACLVLQVLPTCICDIVTAWADSMVDHEVHKLSAVDSLFYMDPLQRVSATVSLTETDTLDQDNKKYIYEEDWWCSRSGKFAQAHNWPTNLLYCTVVLSVPFPNIFPQAHILHFHYIYPQGDSLS